MRIDILTLFPEMIDRLFQNQALHHKQYRHKAEVDCGEHKNIVLCFIRIMFLVLGEGN